MRNLGIIIILLCFSIILSSSLTSAPPQLSNDQIAVTGTIYYWNLEDVSGYTSCTAADDFSNIPGGKYLPIKRMYVEAEFDTLSSDPSTYTNEDGSYYIRKSGLTENSSYSINLELRAKTILNTRFTIVGNLDTVATVFNDWYDVYAVSIETPSNSVRTGETLNYDIYLGGPNNNVLSSNQDDLDAMAAIWITQDLRQFYQKLLKWAPNANNMPWDTYIKHPEGGGSYRSSGLPATGHIELSRNRLFPSELVKTNDCMYSHIGDGWNGKQATLRHEYSHQIMHMVLGSMPADDTGGHGLFTCTSPETAWTEGWAEFLPAAVLEWPTVEGLKGGSHLEFNYNPYTDVTGDVINEPFNSSSPPNTELGNINWHFDIQNSCGQLENSEGEVAAVLWDIFDPKGWEYLDERYQPSSPNTGTSVHPPDGWTRPLRWYDSLEDSVLYKMWTIFLQRPWNLSGDQGLDESSFVYKWMHQFRNDESLVHGLKAVLYNRGIYTELKPENPPSISDLEVNVEDRTISAVINDPDTEDQKNLFYNVCYKKSVNDECEYFYNEDQPLSGKQDGQSTIEIQIPRGMLGCQMILMVHDNMWPVFKIITPSIPDEVHGSLNKITNLPTSFASAVAVQGNYVYLADMEDGLYVFDITDPLHPQQISLITSDGNRDLAWNGAMDVSVNSSYAYLATNSGALIVVDVSNPAQPSQVTVVELEGVPNALAVGNRKIYVACGNAGLAVINILYPNSPWVEQYVDLPGESLDVSLRGNRVYIAGGTSGMQIVGGSTFPYLQGQENYSSTMQTPSILAGNNNLVFITDHKLRVLDFSTWQPGQANLQNFVGSEVDPLIAHPLELSAIDLVGIPGGMSMEGTGLYLAESGKVHLYDISIPELAYQSAMSNPVNALDVAVKDTVVYAAAGNQGLVVLTDSGEETQETMQALEMLGEWQGQVADMAFSDNTGFIASRRNGLKVINITNPENMTTTATYNQSLDNNHPLDATGVDLNGNTLYLSSLSGDLHILSNMGYSAPQQLAIVDSNLREDVGQWTDLDVQGGFAYTCSGTGGLRLVYINDVVGKNWATVFTKELTDCTDIIATDDYAYALGSGSGLHIFDMEIKLNFTPAALWSLPSGSSGTGYSNLYYDQENHLLYVTAEWKGFYILDVSNPAKPIQLGSFKNGHALGIAVQDNIAYVGDEMVIHMVDVSDPTNPVELGTTPLSPIPDLEITAPRMKIFNGILFVGTDRQSLLAFRLPTGN